MEVEIFDINGKKVVRRSYYPEGNHEQLKFDLKGNDKGIYIVSIIVENAVRTRRLRLK